MKKQAVLGDPAQIEKAIRTVASLRSKIGKQKEDSESNSAASEGSESAALATQEGESG
ncbi:MAG TPA: hypothetical protein VD736_08105 [Nitrososphaera sp.]|nr:hypothetical protein [Nitrososphaera sp.]